MTWSKLSDTSNDDLWDLTDGAYRCHVSAIVYSNRNLTDGFIGASRLAAVMPGFDQAYVEELTSRELWAAVDGGYQIVGFLEDQPSKADVERRRAANRSKVAVWRASGPRNLVTQPVTQPTTYPVTPGTGSGTGSTFSLSKRNSRSRGNPVTSGTGAAETTRGDGSIPARRLLGQDVCAICHSSITYHGTASVIRDDGLMAHDACISEQANGSRNRASGIRQSPKVSV
jgi:hypothetical protein